MGIDIGKIRSAPRLPQVYLEGPAHISGWLYFSPDERHLVSLDFTNNFVIVWNIETGRLIHGVSVPVLDVSMPYGSDGVHILVETGVVFLRFRPDGCDETAISSFSFEGAAREELPCAIHASENRILASCGRRAVVIEANDPSRQSWYRMPAPFNECSTCFYAARSVNGNTVLELLDVNCTKSSVDWRYSGICLPSGDTITVPFRCEPSSNEPNKRRYYGRLGVIREARSFLAVLSKSEGRVLAMTPLSETPSRTMTLNLAKDDSELWLSHNGYVIGEQTRSRLKVWKLGELYQTIDVDEKVEAVRLSDDGSACAIYYFGVNRSALEDNVTGFCDLGSGKLIGSGKDHVHGFDSPWAYSPSGTYFASLIIDNTAIGHPSGLASGTVVITRLRGT